MRELTAKQKQSVTVLEVTKLEEHFPNAGRYPGRPLEDRLAIARAFVTKMVYDMATTRILLDRLESDPTIRRICGWERREDVPSESTFSRAFDEFAESCLPQRLHQALIEERLSEQLVGHISRDSTAINARGKPEKKPPPPSKRNPNNEAVQKKAKNTAKNPLDWNVRQLARISLKCLLIYPRLVM